MAGRIRRFAPLTAGALGLCVACGTSSGGSAGPDSGSTPCGDYFDALVVGTCGTGPVLPDDELARVRGRFEQACLASMTLPGSQLTDTQLEACAVAIRAAGCTGAATLPSACVFFGTLAAGSACNEAFQCESGLCFQGASAADAGGAPMSTQCGRCEPVIAAGQPCGSGTCEQGTLCDPTTTKPTCVHPSSGAAGAACNGATTVCDAGLFCDVTTMKCTATFAVGQSCTSSSECTAPATCRAKKCQGTAQAGADCYVDTDCASGLGCSQGLKCGPVVWVSAGQACSDLQRCLVGDCGGGGTCPAVISDGQPCPSDAMSTCDSLAACSSGICALEDSSVCM